ncbi:unnamed protein product [Heterobilharzia americana]|nr:unnamed protein product [Heterobilharzia americana]
MRTPRASWPIGRPTLNPAYASCSRLQSQCYNPVVPPAVRCFLDSDQNAGSRNIGENFTAPQVPSVVDNVSDQLLVAGKPFVSSSSSAILCGSSGIPAQSSTNTTVCSGPLKRTVVHKYHSFRKILPKSDRPVMLPTAPGYSISPFGANTIGLGRFSVPNSSFSIYRPGGFTANTVLPCEVSTDGTYVMDLGASNITDDGSTISVRHSLCGTSVALTSSNSPVLATNPASQLLKSLLECDDSRTNTVITTVTTTSNLSFTAPTIISTPNSTSGSSTPLWNQPAHQSRGTWQLGKRAVSSSTHRSPSDNSSPKLSHSCFPTSGNSTQSHSPPTSSDPPPILPPTLRLTPGSTSRLQQLQQHYQRQQEAQRRFEQDSLNKLGVADSV